MPRKLSHLVITKIRRIAHPSQEAECTARFLQMQVILICVVHAAQKAWYAQRMACGDHPEEPEEDVSLTPGPADSPGIPLRVVWACSARLWGIRANSPGLNCFTGRGRLLPLISISHRPFSG